MAEVRKEADRLIAASPNSSPQRKNTIGAHPEGFHLQTPRSFSCLPDYDRPSTFNQGDLRTVAEHADRQQSPEKKRYHSIERKMTQPGEEKQRSRRPSQEKAFPPPDPAELLKTFGPPNNTHKASILPRNFVQSFEDPRYGQWASKHVRTEVLVPKHAYKAKISKYQSYLDRAVALINLGSDEAIIEGTTVIAKVLLRSWVIARIGQELAYGLCDYLRDTGILETIVQHFISPTTTDSVRMASGKALEECMSSRNRAFIVQRGYLEPLFLNAKAFAVKMQGQAAYAKDAMCCSISLMESMFKQSAEISLRIIELGALDHIIEAIKSGTSTAVHKHAGLALANLSMFSDSDCQRKMIAHKVQDWLFLLASLQDEIARYYACLAICMLVSNKEIEKDVIKSGTLALVEPFLLQHSPEKFALSDYRHSQGRPKEWLSKMIPLLRSSRREARSLAAYHMCMEAVIKKDQENMKIFQEIEAVEALKEVASSPDDVPAKFARMALKIIGEEVPYKLSHQVPLWSIEDVVYWVTKIGFKEYAKKFEEQMVDGDLLLLLTDEELEKDIGMVSGLLRKRFQRELDSLKIASDYGCVDETHLDRMLMSINPELSIYTYRLLEMGLDTNTLSIANDDMLEGLVGIRNPVHRSRILHISQECNRIEDLEMEILRKHIEIFVSYRRSTGSQLASLIKVLLQLRGKKVFIDVDRLYAGKFDASLLKNIKAASHFLLVLSPGAMDRCLDDEECEDWVHKEIKCAMDHGRNIVPIFDPGFEWPDESRLPADIRAITRFNGVRWVHEYQEACVDKLERFLSGELNNNPPNRDRGTTWPAFPTLNRPPSPPPVPPVNHQHQRRPKSSVPLSLAAPERVVAGKERSKSHAETPHSSSTSHED